MLSDQAPGSLSAPWTAGGGPAAPALLLNANARLVSERMQRALASLLPARDLFLSRDAEDAARIADAVVRRGYATVFTGGGDGTFVSFVNHIAERAELARRRTPRFGVLALGTGNAVAEVAGARRDAPVQDLRDFLAGNARSTRRLDLLACDGRRTPFAGLGIDAAVLNDYNWLKEKLGSGALRGLGTGIPGYGLAVALRSAPRQILERRPTYCEIVNTGRPAWRLDGGGRPVGQPVETGELLHAGPCMMAAAATVPFYGFGLRAFPYAATRPGMMQVRVVSQVPVATLLWNLPQVWSGQFAHPGLVDFHAEQVEITFERPTPLQLGGDACGWRERVVLGMARPVELVDFQPSLPN